MSTDGITRTARAHWEGDVAKGNGRFETESGVVKGTYSFGTRFATEPGTNPEELIASAHAACFSMALAAGLTRGGHPPTAVDTTARVTIRQDGGGFTITGIALQTRATVPGLDAAAFKEAAEGAKAGCPVSKALSAVPITLDAALSS